LKNLSVKYLMQCAAILLFFSLTGCDAMMYKPFAPGNALNSDGTLLGGSPTEAAAAAGDYGHEIDQATAQQAAEAWLQLHLKDGESARNQWGTVQRGYAKDPLITGGDVHYGFMLPVMVNAKNSFGGYTGFELRVFFSDTDRSSG
jgi:hypothetical protein